MSRRSRSRLVGPPPFFARAHVLDVGATVELDGRYFMTVATKQGADRLAEILNAAIYLSLDGHLLTAQEDCLARMKIAGAVANALGGAIDFESFTPRRTTNQPDEEAVSHG